MTGPRPALPPLPDVPFVSVYTCVYNHERFVAEAIESVLAEDWPADRMEYVVIDDGSTDSSPAAVEPYLDRIRYIRHENQGVRKTVNRVMSELRGDLVVSVAGDDAWPTGRLRRLVDLMQRNPTAGLGYSDLEVIDDTGATIHPSFTRMSNITPHTGRVRGLLLGGNFVSGGGVILRGCLKDVWHPVPVHAAWEDWWWAWAVSGVADIAYLDEATYRYRQHGANISLGATGDRLLSAMRIDLRFRRWMLRNVGAHEAAASELLYGLIAMDSTRRGIEHAGGDLPAELLPTAPEDEHEASELLDWAKAAVARGDALDALFAAVRAAAAAPIAHAPRALIAAIVPDAAEVVLAGAVEPPPAPAASVQVRSFVVLADAGELVADPALLSAFGARFRDDDDATLVIHGEGWSTDRLAAEVGGLVAHLSLDGGSSPDMVALGSETSRAEVRAAAAAVLGSGFAGGPPAFDADKIGALRELAEAHWAGRG